MHWDMHPLVSDYAGPAWTSVVYQELCHVARLAGNVLVSRHSVHFLHSPLFAFD